ncbi:MAG: hypothetical protein LUB56_03000 [Coprobacillus sp.]|nr:hypothetical protein [Coprobacillus sp.]
MKGLEKVKPFLWIFKLVGAVLSILAFCMLFGDQAKIESFSQVTTYTFIEVIFQNGANGAFGFIGYLAVIASGVLLIVSYILEARGKRKKAVININLIALICGVFGMVVIAFIPTIYLRTKLDGVTGSALFTAQSATAFISSLLLSLITIFIYIVEPPKKAKKDESITSSEEIGTSENEENNSL